MNHFGLPNTCQRWIGHEPCMWHIEWCCCTDERALRHCRNMFDMSWNWTWWFPRRVAQNVGYHQVIGQHEKHIMNHFGLPNTCQRWIGHEPCMWHIEWCCCTDERALRHCRNMFDMSWNWTWWFPRRVAQNVGYDEVIVQHGKHIMNHFGLPNTCQRWIGHEPCMWHIEWCCCTDERALRHSRNMFDMSWNWTWWFPRRVAQNVGYDEVIVQHGKHIMNHFGLPNTCQRWIGHEPCMWHIEWCCCTDERALRHSRNMFDMSWNWTWWFPRRVAQNVGNYEVIGNPRSISWTILVLQILAKDE